MVTDHALSALIGPAPPAVLFHYTSMEGLLSIVDTGRIRATHIRYLNDWSEAEAMWTLVLKRLREREVSAKTAEEKEQLSQVIDFASLRQLPNQFVASFSEEGDDLSQWRSYCPGQAGFSIGFSAAALRSQWVAGPTGRKPSFVGGQLIKVSYLSKTDISEIDLAIDDAIQVGAQLQGKTGFGGPISRQGAVSAWLSVVSPSYKDSAFFAEREWRIVLSKPHKPMPGQRFRAGKSTVVPYVEIELNRDLDFKLSEEYMIRTVFVGPTPSPDLSVEALLSLFLSKGHRDVRVEKSAIPYRHW
jgi:Protein of unknown function (DUF2971)